MRYLVFQVSPFAWVFLPFEKIRFVFSQEENFNISFFRNHIWYERRRLMMPLAWLFGDDLMFDTKFVLPPNSAKKRPPLPPKRFSRSWNYDWGESQSDGHRLQIIQSISILEYFFFIELSFQSLPRNKTRNILKVFCFSNLMWYERERWNLLKTLSRTHSAYDYFSIYWFFKVEMEIVLGQSHGGTKKWEKNWNSQIFPNSMPLSTDGYQSNDYVL